MHEMSVAINLLELAMQEAAKQNCQRLARAHVQYGALAGIMPEALQLCFSSLIRDTPHKNAILELEELPLVLRCPFCGATFGGEGHDALWEPCPKCGEAFGHIVEQGRELILSRIEALRD